jgi:hypothetical protein
VTEDRTDIVLRSGRFDHVKIRMARALIDGTADLSTTPVTRRLYAGCIQRSGHYLWTAYGERADHHYGPEAPIPWESWDGPLQPTRTQKEGLAVIHYKREEGGPIWTAISFWDRTVDSRGNSSSNFFFDSHLSFADALADAREHWPRIFERFTFEVTEAP